MGLHCCPSLALPLEPHTIPELLFPLQLPQEKAAFMLQDLHDCHIPAPSLLLLNTPFFCPLVIAFL